MKKLILCLFGFSLILNSCIKDTFDTPTPVNPGGGGGGTGTATLATIAQIRAMYAGNGVKVTDKFIEATVISDKDAKNINSQNIVVQDASGGIVVRFSSAHNYALGSKLKITFTGDSLTKYAGLMQIYVPATSTVISTTGGGTITPTTVTIANINSNFSQYESTLVKIVNATFPSGTYSGSKLLNDGSGGTITHYTASASTFSSNTLPTTPVSVTGIVGLFNSTKQVSIRNITDVQ